MSRTAIIDITQNSCASAGHPARTTGTMLDVVKTWMERRKTRNTLRDLPDHLLSDIGVSRNDAQTEWNKPFWRD